MTAAAQQPDTPARADAAKRSSQEVRPLAAIEYGVLGDLRWMSHHDELRMLVRALVRAGWPLAYSQGFNPQPRIAVPLPRSVGVASRCQLARVELAAVWPAEPLHASLAATLPGDCPLTRVVVPAERRTPHAQAVEYEAQPAAEQLAGAAERLAELWARADWPVTRESGEGSVRTVDIRPFVERVSIDGPLVRMRLRVREQATARPSEVLSMMGLSPEDCVCGPTRTQVDWDLSTAAAVAPAAHERECLGQEEDND